MSAGDKTPADDDWSLDPDITNEKWAELTAKAESAIAPSSASAARDHAPPGEPQDDGGLLDWPTIPEDWSSPGGVRHETPDRVNGWRAIKMAQRSCGGTDLDGAVWVLKAASDPAASIRIELHDGTALDAAKLSPNVVKRAFIGTDDREHRFEDVSLSYWGLSAWLGEHVLKSVEFPSRGTGRWRWGTAAWPQATSQMSPQREIDNWMLEYYKKAHDEGRPVPKRDQEAFPDCREAFRVMGKGRPREFQMKAAMRAIPEEYKRKRGERDR